MNNQEILDNAPEGATHVDNFELYWMIQDRDSFNWQGQVNGWLSMSSDTDEFRSLEDIKRIAELEEQLTQVEDTFICHWVNFDAADIPLSMSKLLEFNALCARDASICREAAIQNLEQQAKGIEDACEKYLTHNAKCTSMSIFALEDEVNDLRIQVKQLRKQAQGDTI